MARAARARRPHGGGRPQGRRLLGRHEAPPRPRAGARPPALDPLPRRADHRPRPPEPQRAVGRGRAAGRGGRRDRLPHHAVPRGGRRARRPRGDHRPRPHRRRGNADATQGRDRRSTGRGRPRRPGRARRAMAAVLGRFGEPAAPRPRASRCASPVAPSDLAEVVRALDAEGIASPTCSCTHRRSTTSSWPRPAARSRARRGGRRPGAREPRRDPASQVGLPAASRGRSAGRCASRPSSSRRSPSRCCCWPSTSAG